MSATFPYSNEYEPPAPVLPVLISKPGGNLALEVMGLCDTGADITCLPTEVLASLGLVEVDEIDVASFEGDPVRKPVYAAQIRVAALNSQIARVISIDGPDMILGRDLLNSLQLELNGPSKTLRVL